MDIAVLDLSHPKEPLLFHNRSKKVRFLVEKDSRQSFPHLSTTSISI